MCVKVKKRFVYDKMNLQLLPNSCGFEVSAWWCPLTDLTTYFICIGMALLSTGIIYLITKRFARKIKWKI